MTDTNQKQPFTELNAEDLEKVAGGAMGGGKGPAASIIVRPGDGQPEFQAPTGTIGPPDITVYTPQGVIKPKDGVPPGA